MRRRLWLLVQLATFIDASGEAATVKFTDNSAQNYTDIFYTVTPGAEFTNWELQVIPIFGSVLDPDPYQRSFNTASGNTIPIDTFANTVYSAVGAGPASYVFTEYNPGSPGVNSPPFLIPPVPPQPAPTSGAQSPNPDEMRWSIYDTDVGDGNVTGYFPYHMARVVYSPGAHLHIYVRFVDTSNPPRGELFAYPQDLLPAPDVPEPSGVLMASLAFPSLIAVRRKLHGVT
jgi:hypothetical protein